MARLRPSEHRIYSNMGDYVDVELNMVNVIQRYISSDVRYSKLDNIEFLNVNPNLISVKKVPAFFVWCDGSQETSNELGGLGGRRLSMLEDFYCTVKMIHSGADEYENAQLVKFAGSVIKKAIYENLNLNGMMNHIGEVMETNFQPEPFEVGGSFMLMQGFSVTVKYSKTTQSKQATR